MEIAGQNAELPEIRQRIRAFALLAMVALIVLLCRLFYLQVMEGDSYYRVTTDSIVRTRVLPALRGEIRDRKGRLLATTRPSFNVMVVPERIDAETYQSLLSLLRDQDRPIPDWETFQENVADRRDRAYTLAEDVAHDVMARLETSMDSRGVYIQTVPRRQYPFGVLAAHALGYLNEVSADDLRVHKDEEYAAGDLIGRAGIEKQWEPYLRGRKGMRKYIVSRRGLDQGEIRVEDLVDGPAEIAPVPGENLTLTMDMDVQRLTERALGPHPAAAAVVLDVNSGRILAMVSRPGYDPNLMSGRLTPDAAFRLFSDPQRPLRDRTLSDTFSPGSTFKVVSAIAALEDAVLGPDERVKCNHFVQVGRRRFHCTKTHNIVNLPQALTQSCNVYFYELAQRPAMMNRLARYATEMGLGAPAGLGLNGEQGGFVPTEEWHIAQEKDSGNQTFSIGHALNTAIGEGATRVTVLQMALLYAAIAKDGVLWLPQIIERIESPEGRVLESFAPRARKHIPLSAETLALLRRSLTGVVADPKGTAFKARSERVTVAGKTGTAQVRRSRRPGDPIPPNALLDHAWFAGFAPATEPRIAFAVLVEHGGYGGEIAAPVAVQIAEKYMELELQQTAAAASSPGR